MGAEERFRADDVLGIIDCPRCGLRAAMPNRLLTEDAKWRWAGEWYRTHRCEVEP